MKLTVNVNPAYTVTNSQPQEQLHQDELEPSYDVIPTVFSQQNRDEQNTKGEECSYDILNRGEPNTVEGNKAASVMKGSSNEDYSKLGSHLLDGNQTTFVHN